MPTIVRPMLHVDGKPEVGDKANCLGVRPGYDVKEENGLVKLDKGGMSVNDRLESIPGFLRAKTEDTGFNGADGPKKLRLFTHGSGAFVEEAVSDALFLHYKEDRSGNPICTAGNVAPSSQMTLAEYQEALAATRDDWR